MEAKDTVMNYELKLCHSLIGKYSLSAIKDVVDEECLAQAKVSFKAGIKEAVNKLEEWRKLGTHLVSDEAIQELRNLGSSSV